MLLNNCGANNVICKLEDGRNIATIVGTVIAVGVSLKRYSLYSQLKNETTCIGN
jgi:hypothetical protein